MNAAIDSAKFRTVLGHYPTGVCAITATNGGEPAAMIVGSFTSVSLDPPLVGFFPARNSSSWAKIADASRFCVNVLGAHQRDLCAVLASRALDKFASVGHTRSEAGCPVLDGAVAWIDCDFHSVTDAGDHFLVLGLVRHLEILRADDPLLFFQGGYGRFAPLESGC